MNLKFLLLFFLCLLPLRAVDSVVTAPAAPTPEDPPVLTHTPEVSPVKVTPTVVEEQPVEKSDEKPPVPPVAESSVILKAEQIPQSPKVGLESVAIPEGTPYFVGARYYEKKSGGWGWIKKPSESWKQARWVAIKETPKLFHVPHRALKKEEDDHEFQYKLLGSFADYQIYDPVRDELLDVFVIEGYESLGLQKSVDRKPGSPTRFASKKSGAYTRRNNTQSDEEGF